MILFGVAVCAVSFFVYAMNLNWGAVKKLEGISTAGLIFTGITLAFAAFLLVYRKTKKTDESDKIIRSESFLTFAAILFISDFIIFTTLQDWIPFLTAFCITFTVLVFIYYLYQREFFYFSCFAAVGCFFLYFAQAALLPSYIKTGFKALLVVFAVFTFVFTLALVKGKGQLKNKTLGLNIKIFEKNSKYFQLFILSVFIAGFAAASFFWTAYFFYTICALLIYVVIIGVYFTVKMM
jgi:hypothetical protein